MGTTRSLRLGHLEIDVFFIKAQLWRQNPHFELGNEQDAMSKPRGRDSSYESGGGARRLA